MSLMQRVAVAAGERNASSLVVSDFEELKNAVHCKVSIDEIAALMAKNPLHARSELQRACREVFEGCEWEHADTAHKETLLRLLMDSVFGFGPIEPMLSDQSITEIMINGPQNIFFERGGFIEKSEVCFSSTEALRALIDRILGPLGRRIDESSPLVNARLPQGHRVNVIISPLALDGPYVTIRKFSSKLLKLCDLAACRSVDENLQAFFTWAVRAKKSILVSGGTGTGKTTLLNALSCEIPFNERIITIEDSAELRFLEHPHVVRLEARNKSVEGTGEVSIRDLVINALRMRPDRIVVGECRGAEALDMLQAMNTGHNGSLTTVHANSSADVVSRLTTMVRYAVDLPVDVIEANIAGAFDVLVQITRGLDGSRFVCEIAEIHFNQKMRRAQVRTLFKRELTETKGKWFASPQWIDEVGFMGLADEKEVQAWKCSIYSAA